MALRCFDSEYTSWQLAMAATILLIAFSTYSVSAAQYEVGNSVGWALGDDLQLWSSQQTFYVGDDLYFSYQEGQHSVLLVTEDDYNNCNTGNAITSDGGTGNMLFTLSNAETYYFICGVEGHCGQGLKLSVTVIAAPSTSTGVPAQPALSPPEGQSPPAVAHSPPYTPYSTPYNTPYNTFHYRSGAAPLSKPTAAMAAIVGAATATALAYACLLL